MSSDNKLALKGHSPYEFRFVICVDVTLKDEMDGTEDAKKDLVEAYKRLYLAMAEVERASEGQIEWESGHESYAPDGQPIVEEALSEARMEVSGWYETLTEMNLHYAHIGFNDATWDLHYDHKGIARAVEDFLWARNKVDHMRSIARDEGWDIDLAADVEGKRRQDTFDRALAAMNEQH